MSPSPLQRLYSHHPRKWREFHYVYPVISRRSRGLSIGVNLNPDKVCNWDCVYCQVDRSTPGPRNEVDLDELRGELDWMLGYAASGEIWKDEQFAGVPESIRRVNDIAFSGDGEPTTCPVFEEACRLAAQLKAGRGLTDVKIIALSNMTMAHRPDVQRGFAILDSNNGEIWAKLEAGSSAYYKRVDRSAVPLDKTLANIRDAGKLRPLVIQSMWMRLNGKPPPAGEFDGFIGHLTDLLAAGCHIKLVQLYTIARRTAESRAAPLTNVELDALAARLRGAIPDLNVQVFQGVGGD